MTPQNYLRRHALSASNVMSGFCKTGISKVFVTSERDLVDSSSSEQLTASSVDDILKLPEAKSSVKLMTSLTSTAQCLTDSPFLDKLKERNAMREKSIGNKKRKKTRKAGAGKVSKGKSSGRKTNKGSKQACMLCPVPQDILSYQHHWTLTVTAVATAIVLFVDFL